MKTRFLLKLELFKKVKIKLHEQALSMPLVKNFESMKYTKKIHNIFIKITLIVSILLTDYYD